MLLKQSLLGIVVFYTQRTTKRGEHSWNQGILSLEAIFSKQPTQIIVQLNSSLQQTIDSHTFSSPKAYMYIMTRPQKQNEISQMICFLVSKLIRYVLTYVLHILYVFLNLSILIVHSYKFFGKGKRKNYFPTGYI